MAAPALTHLPSISDQAERLISLGIAELAGLDRELLFEMVAEASTDTAAPELDGALLVLHEAVAPASVLAPFLHHDDRHGFVVEDMTDVDRFRPIEGITLPLHPVYLVRHVERGDEMANWTPDEALAAIQGAGRTPLTLVEGLHWALQQPQVLERNHCFMTIGSRLRKQNHRLDARTPAIWISNGTGRDGRARRNAPKVGWCWAGNRHTWLGFASAADRTSLGG